MRTKTYERICQELDAGEGVEIAQKILSALKQYSGGITRRELVFYVFGANAQPTINQNNDTQDRKIRRMIADMRARHIPIISTSGKAGYRLDDSEDARRELLSEMISRRTSIDEQIRAASAAWKIPVVYEEAPKIEQGRLL